MTDYPTTNRPSAITDLKPSKWEPEHIAFSPQITTPEIAIWWGNTLAAAATTPGLIITSNGTITRPKTVDEMKAALANEQEDYDRGRAEYIAWVEEGEEPKYTQLYVSAYARAEGLPMPDADENTNNLPTMEDILSDIDELTLIGAEQEPPAPAHVLPNTMIAGSQWGNAEVLVRECEKPGRDQIIITDKNGDAYIWDELAEWLGGCIPLAENAPYTILRVGKKAGQ